MGRGSSQGHCVISSRSFNLSQVNRLSNRRLVEAYVIVKVMHDMQGKEHARRPWRLALALCCALLLVFGATIQIAHVHLGGQVYLTPDALCVRLRT